MHNLSSASPLPYGIPRDSMITVAGTVGIGKTTFARALSQSLQFKLSLEKVDGNPYLNDFYADFQRWSFHLQIYFLAERFKEQRKMVEAGGGYIQDRSIYEDTGIFARMLYENGSMSEVDYTTYTSLFEAMVMTPYFPRPDVLVYLDGSLDQVLHRIQRRGRPMEQSTAVQYWQDLYARYTDWIERFDICPVVRVHIGEYDLHSSPDSIDAILNRIASAIAESRK